MRIVQIIQQCVATMTNISTFISEPRSAANVSVDTVPSPFVLLNRPIDMPYTYRANNVEEVYDILLIYGAYNENTQRSNAQPDHDIEIEAMRIEAKRMVLNLDKHQEVKSVEITQPIRDYIELFDVKASGVFQYLRVVLVPMAEEVCATYDPDLPII
jgi:hypothetical protein